MGKDIEVKNLKQDLKEQIGELAKARAACKDSLQTLRRKHILKEKKGNKKLKCSSRVKKLNKELG